MYTIELTDEFETRIEALAEEWGIPKDDVAMGFFTAGLDQYDQAGEVPEWVKSLTKTQKNLDKNVEKNLEMLKRIHASMQNT